MYNSPSGKIKRSTLKIQNRVSNPAAENKKTINSLINKYFDSEYKPATSLIGVKALAREELMIEIETVARIDK